MAGTITSYNGSTQIWNLNNNLVDTSNLVALEIQVLETKKSPLTNVQTYLNNEKAVYNEFKQGFNSFVTFMREMSSFKGDNKATTVSQSGFVTATASTDAVSGTYSVSIQQLATRHQIAGNSITLNDKISSTAATSIQINGKNVDITTDMTYQQLIDKVNADSSYEATMYTVGGRLFMASTQTGASGAITLAGDSNVLSTKLGLVDGVGAFTNEITVAQDAEYYINDAGRTNMLTSSSNTIDGVIPGVMLKLENVTTSDVTVTVEDATSNESVEKVKAMVDSFNTAISTLASYTAEGTYMQAGNIALATSRAMSNMVMFKSNAGQYLSHYGIEVDKTGRLSVDTTKLQEAFKNDPDAAKAFFFGTSGIAKTMDTELDEIFGETGLTTTKLKSIDDQLSDISKKLADIDMQNQAKQEAIVAKYALFEQQMSLLNTQLASIKALTKSDSNDD